MWYILIMNKDVIYVEPEDDITDIILKIENSKEKIIALVPPKKAGVFRSVVNIKLIAKSGATSGKKVVLVTVDPSIVRLAAAARIPVTKNLQTAPTIPEITADAETAKSETLVEESDGTVETEKDVEELEGGDKDAVKGKASETEKDTEASVKASEDEDDEDKDDEEEEDDAKKKGKKGSRKGATKPSGNKIVEWIKEHKKLAIGSGIGIVALIILLVWAFAIAPAATVTVGVRTTTNSFSENVTFTDKMTDENVEEGKFYLEEKKLETVQEVEFEATGKKNVGEKATGEVVVYTYFKDKGSVPVGAGSKFTFSGMSFIADSGVTLSWDGEDVKACENNGEASAITSGCLIYGRVKVTAEEPGSKYNVAPSNTGWNTTASVGVYSDKAMAGGTDKMISIVQQSDIDKAKEALSAANENENKAKLFEVISDDALVINSSFEQKTGDAISTPGVGEEVKDGEKAKLKAITTAKIDSIDETKVIEYITKKVQLADDQKIYDIKDPFIESFSKTDSGYTGKLKTTYLTGPKLSVSSIVDMIRGKGVGDAQHLLKDIDGVTDVKIDTSFPWVMAIPGDSNKITVNLEVKDQEGNKVEQKDDDEKKEESKDDSKDEKKSDEKQESEKDNK